MHRITRNFKISQIKFQNSTGSSLNSEKPPPPPSHRRTAAALASEGPVKNLDVLLEGRLIVLLRRAVEVFEGVLRAKIEAHLLDR